MRITQLSHAMVYIVGKSRTWRISSDQKAMLDVQGISVMTGILCIQRGGFITYSNKLPYRR
jgi:hypothetical protein